ncbi:MAG: heme-binding protein, partial [Chthoniobacteraceae bacterium]
DEWERIPQALELIKPQVTDDFARTRVEALRALSFVPTKESVELVLLAAGKPRDLWIDYTLQMVLGALEPAWKKEYEAGTLLGETDAAKELLQEAEARSKPGGLASVALKKFLLQPTHRAEESTKLIAEIAKGKGNVDSGKAVFRRICIACHKYGKEGIEYGPAAHGTGSRLKREEIVESILEPNAKIDPKFLTTNIETNDGGVFTGFVTGETPEILTLTGAGGVKQELKTADLKKRETVKQSSMPEGLANGMSPTEFLDLVEFLASLKSKG